MFGTSDLRGIKVETKLTERPPQLNWMKKKFWPIHFHSLMFSNSI